ncbi:MAG: DUF2840 domain-containing protein [Sphingomonadales bacterium]|nr:DUF2840 domain-containing protein [Sphingomonadales bacterium]
MPDLLTRVALCYFADEINHWLRFGAPMKQIWVDRRHAFAFFRPGQIFGYVCWEGNNYGTQSWRFLILKTGDGSRPLYVVPGVVPGAEILLDLSGVGRVRKALDAISRIEVLGIDPASVPIRYYRYVQNRLFVGLLVRPYSLEEHERWQRQGILLDLD